VKEKTVQETTTKKQSPQTAAAKPAARAKAKSPKENGK
jgi:hypothetical protein